MDNPVEHKRIEDHLAVIRSYLKDHFPGSTLTEVSAPGLYHKFTVTTDGPYTHYKLKVSWARLSDHRNTPENTRSALDSGDVASGMRQIGKPLLDESSRTLALGDDDYYW